MRESVVEAHLRAVVQSMGGEALKFLSPGRRHVTDRLVILPGGRIWMIETKAPGKKPRPGQQRFIKRMQALGCHVLVLATKQAVDQWADSMHIDAQPWRGVM